jgi:hypothetical protein
VKVGKIWRSGEGSERPPITPDTQPVLSDAILVTLLFRMLPRRSL